MFSRIFSFTGQEGAVKVSSGELYQDQKGYGFLREENPQTENGTAVSDKFTGTGGWIADQGYPLAGHIQESPFIMEEVMLLDSAYGVELFGHGVPLRFRAAVPEKGVYAITVVIQGGMDGLKGVSLYSGRRNLVRRDITIASGETFTYQFYVQVCEYIPVVGKPPVLDLSVYISVMGNPARLSSVTVKKAEAPTLYLAGDSLVADYPGLYPFNPLCNTSSWGQNLLQYFDGLAVCNQAHPGLTTQSFREDGHWDVVLRNLCPGDIFMMEFGHADQRRRALGAYGGYASNLRWYIKQIKERGAYPVLVTPLSRIPQQNEDGWYDLLSEYAMSCHKIGREWKVPVIDNHTYSFELFSGKGNVISKDYFVDNAHTNEFGALAAVQFLAKELRTRQIQPLASCMNVFDKEPWKPNATQRKNKRSTNSFSIAKPELPQKLPELIYADCRNIRQGEKLREALLLGFSDPNVKFFHPFELLPRAEFLDLFFHVIKLSANRPYQGRYCDLYRYEYDAEKVQLALEEEFIDDITTPEDRFRPDDGISGGELLSFVIRSLHPKGQRNLSIIECERQAQILGLIWEGYDKNKEVNRADCMAVLVHMAKLLPEEIEALPPPAY